MAAADPEEGFALRRRIGVLAVIDEEMAEALGEKGCARLDRLALEGGPRALPDIDAACRRLLARGIEILRSDGGAGLEQQHRQPLCRQFLYRKGTRRAGADHQRIIDDLRHVFFKSCPGAISNGAKRVRNCGKTKGWRVTAAIRQRRRGMPWRYRAREPRHRRAAG